MTEHSRMQSPKWSRFRLACPFFSRNGPLLSDSHKGFLSACGRNVLCVNQIKNAKGKYLGNLKQDRSVNHMVDLLRHNFRRFKLKNIDVGIKDSSPEGDLDLQIFLFEVSSNRIFPYNSGESENIPIKHRTRFHPWNSTKPANYNVQRIHSPGPEFAIML